MEVLDVRNLKREEKYPLIFEKLRESEELDVIIETEPTPLIKRLKDEGYSVTTTQQGDYVKLEIRKPEIVPGRCPGAATILRPKLEIVNCPDCGAEVERWTDEIKGTCDNCGREIIFDIDSCIEWCEYAKKCVGDEKYEKIMEVMKVKEALSRPLPDLRKYIRKEREKNENQT
jgi:uncharacterized protein (DUF2249 family)